MKLKTSTLWLLLLAMICFVCLFVACDNSGNQNDDQTPPCTHSSTKEVITKQATCTTEGAKNVVCNSCGEILQQNVAIAKIDHVAQTTATVIKAPTCQQDGSQGVFCSICNQVLSTSAIPALGHDFGVWQVVADPTTNAQGLYNQVCQNGCGEYNERAIPLLSADNYNVTTTTSTCTENGSTVYSSDEHGNYTVVLPLTLHVDNPDNVGNCLQCGNAYYSLGLTYELSEDQSYYIVSNKDYGLRDANLVIPAYYNGLPVKEIASDAFVDRTWIKSVVIPETIEKIGAGAFNNTGLTKVYFNAINCQDFNGRNWVFAPSPSAPLGNQIEVVIGQKVKHIPARMFFPLATDYTREPLVKSVTFQQGSVCESIGEYAFYLTNITSITLPDTVTTVGKYAFYNTNLQTVVLGDHLKTLGDGAFGGCTSLTKVVFNSKIERIGSDCFNYCTKLDNVDLTCSKVAYIGVDAFKQCTALKTIKLPKTLQVIDASAFYGCTALESATLPQSVTTIGALAYAKCSNLTEVAIPQGVTSIGNGAFSDCTKLTKVSYNATNCADFEQGNNVFANVGKLTIEIGDNVTHIPARFLYASANVDALPKVEKIVVGKGVTTIGDYAFFGVQIDVASYLGTSQSWQQVTIGAENDALTTAILEGNV